MDAMIAEALKDQNHVIPPSEDNGFFTSDRQAVDIPDPIVEDLTANTEEADECDEDTYDTLIGAELQLQHKGELVRAKVTKRAKGEDGNPIGRCHPNTAMDTRKYVVEFPDGDAEQYFANIIAENALSQVDSEGRQQLLLECMSDHLVDDTAIKRDHNSNKRHRVGSCGLSGRTAPRIGYH